MKFYAGLFWGITICTVWAADSEAPISAKATGRLVSAIPETDPSHLLVRGPEAHTYPVRVDQKTRVEWRGGDATLGQLRNGDLLELVLEKNAGDELPHAASIVIRDEPAKRPAARPRLATPRFSYYSPTEEFAPRGSLTYSGVVTALAADELTLQPRKGGKVTMRVRYDTRFIRDGVPIEAESLPLQTIVFVRASRHFDGSLECYQVMWGDILPPR